MKGFIAGGLGLQGLEFRALGRGLQGSYQLESRPGSTIPPEPWIPSSPECFARTGPAMLGLWEKPGLFGSRNDCILA